MTRRDIAIWRAAILAGINSAFDTLDAAVTVKRVIVRANDGPEGEVTEMDSARAETILRKHGMR